MYINRMLKSVVDQRISHILTVGDFNMNEINWSLCESSGNQDIYHLYLLKGSKTVLCFKTLENPHALEKAKYPVYWT